VLTLVKVDNFKCLDDFELALADHALLMGLNGSGKSTVVEVLERLRRLLVDGERAGECFPPSTRTRWASDSAQTFELGFENGGRRISLRIVLEHRGGGTPVRVLEEAFRGPSMSIQRRAGSPAMVDAGPGDPATGSILIPDELAALPLVSSARTPSRPPWSEVAVVAGILPFHLDPTHMSAMASDASHALAPDGGNFASWLLWTSRHAGTRIAAVEERISAVLPAFRSFSFVPVGPLFRLDTDWGPPDIVSPGATRRFAFDELSDGQRLLMVLAAIVEMHGSLSPVTVVLDEPDNFVALQEIQPLLLSLLDAANLQLVVASHHPEIIDLMAAQYGYAFSRDNDVGAVRIERWRAPPDSMLPASELVARGDIDGGA